MFPRSPVNTETGDDLLQVYHPGSNPSHSGPLSLSIPPRVRAMSTGNGFGHLWEETAPLKLQPRNAL